MAFNDVNGVLYPAVGFRGNSVFIDSNFHGTETPFKCELPSFPVEEKVDIESRLSKFKHLAEMEYETSKMKEDVSAVRRMILCGVSQRINNKSDCFYCRT